MSLYRKFRADFLVFLRMEHLRLSWAVLLMNIYLNQASRAGTPLFVKTGDDVLLNVTESEVPEEFIFFLWKFNTDTMVVFSPGKDPDIRTKYSGRIELGVNKYFVKLKNLQKSDSGVYIARLTADKDSILAEYNVTVEEPVSPVRLVVDSVSSRSDSCNLTVTCSSEHSDSSSTFTCHNEACYQEGGEITKSGHSLQIYLLHESIICNHSNQVSWAKNTRNIWDHCTKPGGTSTNRNHYIIAGIVAALALIVITAVVIYRRKRRTYDTERTENTVYAAPQFETTLNENPASDAHGPSPNTTYSTVGFPNPVDSSETEGKPPPETVYAQVQKPTRT